MVVQEATVLSPGTKSMLQKLMVLDVAELTRAAVEAVGKERRRAAGACPAAGKLTSLLAATLGPSGGVAACLMESGGLGVALPCASTRRSRILPDFFDGCSCVGRREMMNESVFSQSFSADWRYWSF